MEVEDIIFVLEDIAEMQAKIQVCELVTITWMG